MGPKTYRLINRHDYGDFTYYNTYSEDCRPIGSDFSVAEMVEKFPEDWELVDLNEVKIGSPIDGGIVVANMFYVVATNMDEGGLEQITNGLNTYRQAKEYRDSPSCKGKWPNAFIICTIIK